MDASAATRPVGSPDASWRIAFGNAPWGDSLLAALPHLWIGLSAALAVWGRIYFFPGAGDLISRLGEVSLVIFLAFSLGVIVYAWRSGWPLWSASWYFYAAWIVVILLGYLVSLVGQHPWVANMILILGGFAGMALGYLALFRYSRLHALLAGPFLMPVATQFDLEAIPDSLEGFLSLLFGLLAALVAIAVLRTRNWRLSVAFALAANILAGIALTYISFYHAEIPGFYGNSFLEALLAFAAYVCLAAALYTGPLVFWWILDRIRRSKRGST